MHKKAKLHVKNKKGNNGTIAIAHAQGWLATREQSWGGGSWVFKECANRKVHSTRVKLDFQIQGITQSITVSGKLGRPQGGNNFLWKLLLRISKVESIKPNAFAYAHERAQPGAT